MLGVAGILTAIAALLGWYTDAKRRAKVEPIAAITQGAATLATALESVVGPLRDEVIELRAQMTVMNKTNDRLDRRVRVLTEILVKHGIPVPDDEN